MKNCNIKIKFVEASSGRGLCVKLGIRFLRIFITCREEKVTVSMCGFIYLEREKYFGVEPLSRTEVEARLKISRMERQYVRIRLKER